MIFIQSACLLLRNIGKSTAQCIHRVAVATFWRTFHHDGKISTPNPFHYICHHVHSYKVVYTAPAERLLLLLLFPSTHSVVYSATCIPYK
jgi:hypothetical protein